MLMTISHQTLTQAEYFAKITEYDRNSHTEAASWRLDASSLKTTVWKRLFFCPCLPNQAHCYEPHMFILSCWQEQPLQESNPPHSSGLISAYLTALPDPPPLFRF